MDDIEKIIGVLEDKKICQFCNEFFEVPKDIPILIEEEFMCQPCIAKIRNEVEEEMEKAITDHKDQLGEINIRVKKQ
jgi:uncharacterized protein YbaR (Trm112 family)